MAPACCHKQTTGHEIMTMAPRCIEELALAYRKKYGKPEAK